MADLDFTINADTRRAQQNLQMLENKVGAFKKTATGNNTVNVDTGRATSAIQALQNKFKSLTDSLKANNSVNVDTSRAISNIKGMETATKASAASMGLLKTAIASIGIAAFIQNTGQLAKTLNDISRATGMSVAEIRGFQQAIAASGGTTDQANDGLKDLIKNIGGAALGSKELQSAFSQVGVSLDDLRTKSEGEILRQVLDGLAKIPDSATRSATSAKILGEALSRVDFRNATNTIGGFTEKAKELNTTVDKVATAQKNLGIAFDNLQNATLKAIAPIAEFLAKLEPAHFERFVTAVVQIGGALAVAAGGI